MNTRASSSTTDGQASRTIIHKGFTILPDQREVLGGVTFFAVEGFSDLAYCPRHRTLVDVGGEMTDHIQRHRDEEHDRWEHEP